MCVNNLPRVALDSGEARIRTRDLLIAGEHVEICLLYRPTCCVCCIVYGGAVDTGVTGGRTQFWGLDPILGQFLCMDVRVFQHSSQ